MTETEKLSTEKRNARAQALNGELEQSSKFAELRAMHFRAFLNMRLWWQFWKTPTRLFQLAHECASIDYLTRVSDAQEIARLLKEQGISFPKMAVLLGAPAEAPAATPLQLTLAVDDGQGKFNG